MNKIIKNGLIATGIGGAMILATAVPTLALVESEVINACANQRTGDLRVLTDGDECDARKETPVVWNVQGPQGLPGTPGEAGIPGIDGASAYDLWIEQGNTGTKDEFLSSLIGPQGPAGEPGKPDPLSLYEPDAPIRVLELRGRTSCLGAGWEPARAVVGSGVQARTLNYCTFELQPDQVLRLVHVDTVADGDTAYVRSFAGPCTSPWSGDAGHVVYEGSPSGLALSDPGARCVALYGSHAKWGDTGEGYLQYAVEPAS